MNDDEKTLGILIRTSRYASTTRRLVCPLCKETPELFMGKLACLCGAVWDKLAELEAKR